MIDQNYFRVSVKGIVIDETGRFLLSRESDGRWDLLGGGLEHGEDPIVGLKREVQEETGLEVTYVSPTPKYFTTASRFSTRFGQDTYVANVIYEIKLASLDFTPSDECQELKFFNVDEASKIDGHPTVPKLIEVFDPKLHV
jgi:8-oxo-dGTP diphosphatase